MTMSPIGTFQASATALSVSDTGDFLQLRGAANVICNVLEIRVWQEADTTLALNTIRIQRGTTGATGGTGLTNRKYDIQGAAADAAAYSLPTGDVATLDWDLHCGWNILQEFVWLPTPQMQLRLAASDYLGIGLRVTDTLTMGASIIWEEYGA